MVYGKSSVDRLVVSGRRMALILQVWAAGLIIRGLCSRCGGCTVAVGAGEGCTRQLLLSLFTTGRRQDVWSSIAALSSVRRFIDDIPNVLYKPWPNPDGLLGSWHCQTQWLKEIPINKVGDHWSDDCKTQGNVSCRILYFAKFVPLSDAAVLCFLGFFFVFL